MAGRIKDDEDDIIADINVTPLVDITLVLLIIFMVTATYIVKPAIPVDLPKAASGQETQPTTIAIVLTKDGGLYLNGEAVTEQMLSDAIREVARASEDVQALLSADRDVPHGQVVRVIDLLRLNGVSRFAINIDPDVVKAYGDGKPVPVGGP